MFYVSNRKSIVHFQHFQHSTILFWDSAEVTAYDSKSKIILMDLLRLSSTLVHPLKQAILKPLLVTATLKCKTLPLTAKKPNV